MEHYGRAVAVDAALEEDSTIRRALPAWLLLSLLSPTSVPAVPVEHACATAVSPRPVPLPVTGDELGSARRSSGSTPHLGTFTIVIVPSGQLQGNAAALAAFQRGAAQWASFISDPITVTIDANLANLGDPNVIGSTNPFVLSAPYAEIRAQLLVDAASDADDAIVASVPASLSVLYPAGYDLDGDLMVSKAAAKAMGFTGLDGMFGASDAEITFNTQFPFDFDNSDGVGSGLVDFETVAAHEIGHALGFSSSVDSVDTLPPQALAVAVLDLFRFPDGTPNDPSTPATFASASRSQVPGSIDVFDDTAAEHPMSTGTMDGDGRQASHWKDDALTGTLVGMMDPTLGDTAVFTITDADRRALDVIGYDVLVGGGTTTTTLAPCDALTCDDADACTVERCEPGAGCIFDPFTITQARALIVDPAGEAACTDSRPGSVTPLSRAASRALGKAEVTGSFKKRRALLRKADNQLFKASLKLSKGIARGRVTQPCADVLGPGLDQASDAVDCIQAAS